MPIQNSETSKFNVKIQTKFKTSQSINQSKLKAQSPIQSLRDPNEKENDQLNIINRLPVLFDTN